jgi:hypothetical protein
MLNQAARVHRVFHARRLGKQQIYPLRVFAARLG